MSNDGGPAFPESDMIAADGVALQKSRAGMSLRDYFAAMAMQGLCGGNSYSETIIAREAYALADAMLAERAKATA